MAVHGLNTPHGLNTQHGFPVTGDDLDEIMLGLARDLYPTGRAFWIPEGGVFEDFHIALNKSLVRLITDGLGLFDSNYPDNNNFTEDDAAYLEHKYGLVTNTSLTLEERKTALLRKIAFPDNIRPRQHPFYIEKQLRDAGFDVYVHENTIPYQTPADVAALSAVQTQYGPNTQYGQNTQYGSARVDVIANSLNPLEIFNIGGAANLWAIFFIGGQVLGDIATVPATRQTEFRELVLKLKPAHTAAYTIINYV